MKGAHGGANASTNSSVSIAWSIGPFLHHGQNEEDKRRRVLVDLYRSACTLPLSLCCSVAMNRNETDCVRVLSPGKLQIRRSVHHPPISEHRDNLRESIMLNPLKIIPLPSSLACVSSIITMLVRMTTRSRRDIVTMMSSTISTMQSCKRPYDSSP
jgi:hypothetical protein